MNPKIMNDPCIQKMKEDEPFFVLLGRDADAAAALQLWIDRRLVSEGRTEKVIAAEKNSRRIFQILGEG